VAGGPRRHRAVGAGRNRRHRPRREFRPRGSPRGDGTRNDRSGHPCQGRRGTAAMSEPSWTERLFGGFRKTSERLTENLSAAVGTAKLDDATLDEVEDALILSDLG